MLSGVNRIWTPDGAEFLWFAPLEQNTWGKPRWGLRG